MAQTQSNEPRISMRVDAAQKALIERGAAERALFTLDDETYGHFLAILDRPAQDKPELRRLAERNRGRRWTMGQ